MGPIFTPLIVVKFIPSIPHGKHDFISIIGHTCIPVKLTQEKKNILSFSH